MKNQLVLMGDSDAPTAPTEPAPRPIRTGRRAVQHNTREAGREGIAAAREALAEASRRATAREMARREARDAALLAAAAHPRLPHIVGHRPAA